MKPNLWSDAPKAGHKLIEQLRRQEEATRQAEFVRSARWSFDPTPFDFRVHKVYKDGILTRPKLWTRLYRWEATKVVRWVEPGDICNREFCDVYYIRRNYKTGEYRFIRERTEDRADDAHNYPKTTYKAYHAMIHNMAEAEEVLKEIGALRGWKKGSPLSGGLAC